MYIATAILFILPVSFIVGVIFALYRQEIPAWRRKVSILALSIAGISTLVHFVWNISWIHSGGSPHGMDTAHGLWWDLSPFLFWSFCSATVLAVLCKGWVRGLLLTWSVSMYAVFGLVYMLQFD